MVLLWAQLVPKELSCWQLYLGGRGGVLTSFSQQWPNFPTKKECWPALIKLARGWPLQRDREVLAIVTGCCISTLVVLKMSVKCRGGVESNQTNFELIFIKVFELFFTFRINRIINFRIESNEFRTNPASEKFDTTL